MNEVSEKMLYRCMRRMDRIMDSRIKYLEKEEVYRLFAAIPPENLRDRALFDLIYRHGLRRIEVTWLRKEWLSNGRIWIKRAKKVSPRNTTCIPTQKNSSNCI